MLLVSEFVTMLDRVHLWKTFTSGGRYTERMYWWHIAVSIYIFYNIQKLLLLLYFEISSLKHNIVNII